MGRYDGEDYMRAKFCRPEDHVWAQNGTCHHCDRTRESLIAHARKTMELVEEGKFGRFAFEAHR